MISKYTYKGLTWVDLESPTEEELRHVQEEYSIPVTVGEEMRHESAQSKVDLYPGFIYLALHFPQISHSRDTVLDQEIDFVVGTDFVITTHYEFIESLHEFSKAFEVNVLLNKDMDINHAGFLFYHLIKNLYLHSRSELHQTNSLLKDTEDKIFEGKEGHMVEKISKINRTLLDFRQSLRFHKQVLSSFEISAKKLYGESFGFYASSIVNEYNKTQAVLDSHKEILDDLRNTNDSLLANKTTETMKILTIMTFLISPITAISNIFVINSSFLGNQDPRSYYMVLGVMLFTSLVAFIYIKTKKWL
jgi:magnesium transporter